MIQDKFLSAVDEIVERDPRFERDAYLFVRDALEFTAKRRKRASGRQAQAAAAASMAAAQTTDEGQHVSGQELLEGARLYALDQYGPMAPAVFEHWRVTRCEDIGAMVFNLIEVGVFGKTDRDTLEDFSGGYDFHEAFVLPFLPAKAGGTGKTGGGPSSASARKST